jgi:hypothetical protein
MTCPAIDFGCPACGQVSQLMVDRPPSPIDRSRTGNVVGRAESEFMARLDAALSAFLGFA